MLTGLSKRGRQEIGGRCKDAVSGQEFKFKINKYDNRDVQF